MRGLFAAARIKPESILQFALCPQGRFRWGCCRGSWLRTAAA